MKLFVDDIRNAPDESWTVARTVLSAIRAISQFNFEVISLDHDISHQVAVGALSRPYPCEETFESVAWFIAEKYWIESKMKDLDQLLTIARLVVPPKIILHTSNIVGAEKMESILRERGLKCEKKLMGLANRLEMEI